MDMIGVCQDGEATLLVDGGDRLYQRQFGRNWLGDPQPQYVTGGTADLNTRHDVEGVFVLMFAGPQGSIYPIMVGDGDHIEVGLCGDVVQKFTDCGHTIAGAGVHVDVGVSHSGGCWVQREGLLLGRYPANIVYRVC